MLLRALILLGLTFPFATADAGDRGFYPRRYYSQPARRPYKVIKEKVVEHQPNYEDRHIGRFSTSFQTALSFRQNLLFQAEQRGLASRFERRFLDGIQKDDEAELLFRLNADRKSIYRHGRQY